MWDHWFQKNIFNISTLFTQLYLHVYKTYYVMATIQYLQVYSLQLVVEMRTGEVRSLRQQLALAQQQVTNKVHCLLY